MANIEDEIRRIVREEIRAVLDELRVSGKVPPEPCSEEIQRLVDEMLSKSIRKRLHRSAPTSGGTDLPPDPNPNESKLLRRLLSR